MEKEHTLREVQKEGYPYSNLSTGGPRCKHEVQLVFWPIHRKTEVRGVSESTGMASIHRGVISMPKSDASAKWRRLRVEPCPWSLEFGEPPGSRVGFRSYKWCLFWGCCFDALVSNVRTSLARSMLWFQAFEKRRFHCRSRRGREEREDLLSRALTWG